MVPRGTVLRNALNGETFVFSGPVDADDVARMEVELAPGGKGGGDALVHVHPLAEERFTVTRGTIAVTIDGEDNLLSEGRSIVVPRGRPHAFRNAGPSSARLVVELTPAQDHLRFFANFATTVERHPGWYTRDGRPAFLLIALTLHVYRDHFYPAGPPIPLLKVVFAALAPVARLLGYRVEIRPRAG